MPESEEYFMSMMSKPNLMYTLRILSMRTSALVDFTTAENSRGLSATVKSMAAYPEVSQFWFVALDESDEAFRRVG